MKKTALYDAHIAAGGQMVDFAGFALPVQYSGIKEEHMAVRQLAGLFDVSHMGEFELTGAGAKATIDRLTTNNITKLGRGRARYSLMLNDAGFVIDDMLVYCFDAERYWLVVNAANRAKVFAWVNERLLPDTKLEDVSDGIAQLAIQGPKSREILLSLAGELPEKYYGFLETTVEGIPCLISKTGYTGSPGYELYLDSSRAESLWGILSAAGLEHGMLPCGLGARDTLRIEAAMPLYGNEISEDISPLEAGLGFAIKQDKSFIGKDSLLAHTPRFARHGLKVTGRGITRGGDLLYSGDERVGVVTSGTFLPFCNGAYAMALIDIGREHEPLSADVRGRRIAVELVSLPFYKGEQHET